MNKNQKTKSNVWDNNVLLLKADNLAHKVYAKTSKFPKEELFGITSQMRRASLSVCLNIIEGFSRFKTRSHINFLEIAFGSLKETLYLIVFCHKETLLSKLEKDDLYNLSEEVSKMLYSKINTLKSQT